MSDSNRDINRHYLDAYYYNTQQKRGLPFPYMMLTKETILYTIIVMIYLFYVSSFGIISIALIIGGYFIIYQKLFNYKISDKENLWVYTIKNRLLGIQRGDV